MFEKQRRCWFAAGCGLLASVFLAGVGPAWAEGRAMSREPARMDMVGFVIAADGSGKQWRNLPPQEQKERLREWRSLSPQQRRELRERMDRLKRMPDADRRLYERRFRQWQRLPREERRRLLRKFDQWESLPPEEQEAIRQRFRNQ